MAGLRTLAYTVLDDLAQRFDEALASIPGWVVAVCICLLGVALIVGIARRLLALWLMALVCIGGIAFLWFYSGYVLT